MPGIPQVWYLDLFAGKNDYAAADSGGAAGHKEINRTNLSNDDIAERLSWPVVQDQLALIALRNGSAAFDGRLTIQTSEPHQLHLHWEHQGCTATLQADLRTLGFRVTQRDAAGVETSIARP
jgi:sucrose phosphorylase